MSDIIPLNSFAKGVPPAAVLRVLSQHSRDELAGFISIAIDLMDLADGDPDAEDAYDLEDDFTFSDITRRHFMPAGPGCPISDQDAGAYVEWHTMRGSQKTGPNMLAGHEDDEEDDAPEEDDPSGQCDEDGINTSRDLLRFTPGAYGAGCPLADPGERSGHYGQDADI